MHIRNDRFNLSDGVVGLAFDEESRTVYFQPLATDRYELCLFLYRVTAWLEGSVCFVFPII